VVRIEFTPKEIIYNKLHPTKGVQLADRQVRIGVLTLIQEVKPDIIYRRMQLTQPLRVEVPLIRIQAHILSTIRKLTALLDYQRIVQNKEPIRLMHILSDTIISRIP
jgi:hypothetical protein